MEDRNQQTERLTRRSQQNVETAPLDQPVHRTQPEINRDVSQPAYIREKKKDQPEKAIPQNHDSLDEIYRVIDQMEDVIASGKKVPLSRTLSVLDTSILSDLIGQLRMGFPRTVVEAEEIIKNKNEILTGATNEANESRSSADQYYHEKVLEAKRFDQETRTAADKYDRELRALANQDANNVIADAHARAEQIMQAAQRQQSEMVSENEIVRRANAFAMEIRDKAQKESDQVYSQACLQSDKVLSGAAAALSKAANDLAQLRDALLNPNGAQSGNYPGQV